MEPFKGQTACVELAEELPTSGGGGENHLSHSDRLHVNGQGVSSLGVG